MCVCVGGMGWCDFEYDGIMKLNLKNVVLLLNIDFFIEEDDDVRRLY